MHWSCWVYISAGVVVGFIYGGIVTMVVACYFKVEDTTKVES
jgi:hypothetical protein